MKLLKSILKKLGKDEYSTINSINHVEQNFKKILVIEKIYAKGKLYGKWPNNHCILDSQIKCSFDYEQAFNQEWPKIYGKDHMV